MGKIRRVKGDNYDLELEIQDSDGNAIDLSGTTVFFTVKRNLQDSDANALIAVEQTSHVSPTEGLTNIPLNSTETNIEGKFYYNVKIKNGSTITSIEADEIIFLPQVTIRTS